MTMQHYTTTSVLSAEPDSRGRMAGGRNLKTFHNWKPQIKPPPLCSIHNHPHHTNCFPSVFDSFDSMSLVRGTGRACCQNGNSSAKRSTPSLPMLAFPDKSTKRNEEIQAQPAVFQQGKGGKHLAKHLTRVNRCQRVQSHCNDRVLWCIMLKPSASPWTP